METAFVLKGTIQDSRNILLDEIFTRLKGKVEIIIRPIEETKRIENFFTFLNSLPKGTRSKESIDLQKYELFLNVRYY